MAIFGFICGVLILGFLTLGWFFMVVYDGAFGGKRELPIWFMFIVLGVLMAFWYGLVGASPFTVTIAT
tara:strand:+ start:128 stop:331 length:204 start_codon:yes stop_codon:yes gene_type:complete